MLTMQENVALSRITQVSPPDTYMMRDLFPNLDGAWDHIDYLSSRIEEQEEEQEAAVADIERERDQLETRLDEVRSRLQQIEGDIEEGLEGAERATVNQLSVELESTLENIKSVLEYL